MSDDSDPSLMGITGAYSSVRRKRGYWLATCFASALWALVAVLGAAASARQGAEELSTAFRMAAGVTIVVFILAYRAQRKHRPVEQELKKRQIQAIKDAGIWPPSDMVIASSDVAKLHKKFDIQDGRRYACRMSFILACIIVALVWVLAIGLAVIGEDSASVVKAAVVITSFPLIVMFFWRHFTLKAEEAKQALDSATQQDN